MGAFVITIVNDITANVLKDGIGGYKPRYMVPVVSGSVILFQHPSNVNYDFYIDTSVDTITAEGNPITGTAQEIADALLSAVFFTVSGGVADLTSADGSLLFGDWAGSSEYFLDVANENNYASLYARTNFALMLLGGQNASMNIYAYRNSTGNADNDQKVVIEVQNALAAEYRTTNTAPHVFKIGGVIKLIISDAFGDYADDAAAEAAGVPVNGAYHTSGTLKIRLS